MNKGVPAASLPLGIADWRSYLAAARGALVHAGKRGRAVVALRGRVAGAGPAVGRKIALLIAAFFVAFTASASATPLGDNAAPAQTCCCYVETPSGVIKCVSHSKACCDI
ncbi:hypothetical protein DFJ73DRAFT_798020 [Zopfochytrium polystomum]|nr:hypothetical protein DFJ73DRAFT_798020 [Zopfochytrium polystomum]